MKKYKDKLFITFNKIVTIEWLKYISIVLLLIFPVTLATVYLFPLYPDEIQNRLWLSRLPYDFPNRITGLARCLSEFSQLIPFSLYLPATINWVIHGLVESPTSLRRIGIFISFAWLAVLTIYLINKSKDLSKCSNIKFNRINYIYTICFVISLFFIGGVIPFFLVMNRNEQLIFPSIIILIFLIINKEKYEINQLKNKILIIFLYFIAISTIVYSHPKGLFLLPFFLIAAWRISSNFNKHALTFITIVFFTSILIIESYLSYNIAYLCKEIPEWEETLKSYSFNPLSLFYNPSEFFGNSYKSLMRFGDHLDNLIFRDSYVINFLPVHQGHRSFIKFFNILIKINIFIICLGLLIYIPIYYFKRDVKNGNYITLNLALFALYTCIFISSIFNLTKNFYDSGYVYIIISIIFIFFIGENSPFNFESKTLKKLLIFFFSFSILSQVIFIRENLTEFIGGFRGPGVPIGLYEKELVHNSIESASKICEINQYNSQYVVIDDLTYGYFRKSHGPISYTYNLVGNSKNPLKDLFLNTDSSGIIMSCDIMPPNIRSISTKVNRICCLSKNQINEYILK